MWLYLIKNIFFQTNVENTISFQNYISTTFIRQNPATKKIELNIPVITFFFQKKGLPSGKFSLFSLFVGKPGELT